jgi:hypothetical protein
LNHFGLLNHTNGTVFHNGTHFNATLHNGTVIDGHHFNRTLFEEQLWNDHLVFFQYNHVTHPPSWNLQAFNLGRPVTLTHADLVHGTGTEYNHHKAIPGVYHLTMVFLGHESTVTIVVKNATKHDHHNTNFSRCAVQDRLHCGVHVKFFSFHPNFTCADIGKALCVHNSTHVHRCPPHVKLFHNQYCCEFYNPHYSLIDVASRFQARINREVGHGHYGIDKGTVTLEPFNCSHGHRNISAIKEKFCVASIIAPVGAHIHIRDYVHPPTFGHLNWSAYSFASSRSDQNAALNSGAAIVLTLPTGPEPNPYRITLSDSHGPIDVVTVHVVDHGKITPPCHAVASGHAVAVVFQVKPGTKFHVGLAGAILGLNPDEIRECSAAKKATLKPNEACIEFIAAHTKKRQSTGNSPQQNANNFLDALNNGLLDSAGALPGTGVVTDPNPTQAPHPTATHPATPSTPHAPGTPTHAPGTQSTHHGLSAGALAAIIFVSVFLAVAIIVVIAVAIVVKRRDRQHLDHF